MSDSKSKGGAPTKYDKKYNEQVYKLCLLGAIDEELADFFNVCVATINNWKLKEPEFLEALKKGKMIADAEVANSLNKRANGYKYDEVKIVETPEGVFKTVTTKEVAPDPTAQIFILKNRQPKKWRDKQEIDSNVNGNITNINVNVDSEETKDDMDKLSEM